VPFASCTLESGGLRFCDFKAELRQVTQDTVILSDRQTDRDGLGLWFGLVWLDH
jgi:phosphoribosylaminoimidazole-succinocarboxamide synthase